MGKHRRVESDDEFFQDESDSNYDSSVKKRKAAVTREQLATVAEPSSAEYSNDHSKSQHVVVKLGARSTFENPDPAVTPSPSTLDFPKNTLRIDVRRARARHLESGTISVNSGEVESAICVPPVPTARGWFDGVACLTRLESTDFHESVPQPRSAIIKMCLSAIVLFTVKLPCDAIYVGYTERIQFI
ncbi:hypothetical protein EV421DRAFT_1728662 [Armillaria borealis]|uniref:Uncharacterized protein n=1 Tax=Armillaria borealis TaxID=47425 RepID=A0AA39K749_9AGAR|nr:hypothetical protein EV421DRAFT_1728662 [Armillaria borealis]